MRNITELDPQTREATRHQLTTFSRTQAAPVSRDVDGPCRIWGGDTRMRVSGSTTTVAKIAYMTLVAPIPLGPNGRPVEVVQLCHVRLCIAPKHLAAPVPEPRPAPTPRTTRPRAARATDTHCANGHEWTPENTLLGPNGKTRTCRTCNREKARAAAARRRAARAALPPRPRPLLTHCRNGHAYTPENTRTAPNGNRRCRTCQQAQVQARREARRKTAQATRQGPAPQASTELVLHVGVIPGPWTTPQWAAIKDLSERFERNRHLYTGPDPDTAA